MKDVYVITGATGGMGENIAKSISDGIVLLCDLNKEKLDNLKKDILDAETMICDISNPDDIKKLVEKTKSLGHLKALIHTAGLSGSMANWEKIFQVNLIGTKLLLDAFYEIADNSVIIPVASMAGHLVPDSFLYNKILLDPLNPKFMKKMKMFTKSNSQYAYSFSKKGVIKLCEKETTRWGLKKSRIVTISPGTFETPMATAEEAETKSLSIMIKNNPVPRIGKPEEITDLVHYILKAEYLNGCDILIDGGITAHMKHSDFMKQMKK